MASVDLKNDTQSKVVVVIAQVLNKDKETINGGITWNDLNADSLDKIEIIMRLEEAFNIQIDDDTFHSCLSIDSTVDYLHGLR